MPESYSGAPDTRTTQTCRWNHKNDILIIVAGISLIINRIKQQLRPEYDVKRHFTPRYNPWDQRVCLVPAGDLFAAIRSGRVEIVTDTIEEVVKSGIRLSSGTTIAGRILHNEHEEVDDFAA